MALRAMYKGIKKVLAPLIINRPGELAIDQDALNTELNTVFFPRSEEAVLGAKNLLNNTEVTETINDVVLTKNSDGSVTINGTASGTCFFRIGQINGKGSFILSGVTGGSTTTYGLTVRTNDNQAPSFGAIDNYSGDTPFTIPNDYNNALYVNVRVPSGAQVNNVTIYPMIRLASDPDSTYAPYAMTNKELTDAVATLNGSASDQKTAINAIITAATGAADFAAFKTAMGAITPVTRSIQVTPETREEITEPEEEPVKKTTRKKSTAKADTEKEGE